MESGIELIKWPAPSPQESRVSGGVGEGGMFLRRREKEGAMKWGIFVACLVWRVFVCASRIFMLSLACCEN
jgi:hypothetical protein